jgi:hypothetical protein
MTLINENKVHDEIRRIIHDGNVHYPVQKVQYSCLLSKMQKFRAYKLTVMSVVLCDVKCGLSLNKEHELHVPENKVLRKRLGYKKDELSGQFRNYIITKFMTYASHLE